MSSMLYNFFKENNFKLDNFFELYVNDSLGENKGIFCFPDPSIQQITNSLSGAVTANASVEIFKGFINHNFFHKKLNNQIKILDYGCGWGRITRLFSYFVKDSNIYGVDPNEILINAAKKSLPSFNFNLMHNLKELEFSNDYFDLIILNSIFSHLSYNSLNFTLRQLSKILKEKAELLHPFYM